jgi:hypothetical protein
MNNNQSAPLVGQPVTLTAPIMLLINTSFQCTCAFARGGTPTELQVVASAPVKCPLCETTYVMSFQAQGNLQVAIQKADTKVPS